MAQNLVVDMKELIAAREGSLPFLLDVMVAPITYYRGRPVLYDSWSHKHFLWDSCEYCKTTKKPRGGLYNGYYCVSCGAPVMAMDGE